MNKRVGIVVPTLGKRAEFLIQSLRSIRDAGNAYICLVAPGNFDSKHLLSQGLIDAVVADPGAGLAEAINYGIASMPKEIVYVSWLGDDDLLGPKSLEVTSENLDKDSAVVLVYGSCDYIDVERKRVWRNKSGPWASWILPFGPDLIPQPGSLFRRAAFDQVGGLSPAYGWAFDFDLFLKLKKVGKLRFINQTLASFRWHSESLSVEQRKSSVAEASIVRVAHLPSFVRPLSVLWEYPVRLATLIAGNSLTKKIKG